ncbi:MAG: 2-hydroxyglutaryl-CoA dehydratase, partial [bacterium]|nr:2-hydroxyglutaryl-CoA dehydratase [bacterium]
MKITIGVDVGSTYTKAVVLDANKKILGRSMNPTGFRLTQIAAQSMEDALKGGGVERKDVSYIVGTGVGRHQAAFKGVRVT